MPNTETSNMTINDIYEEIIRNRNKLKHSVESSEAAILLKVECINSKKPDLDKENKFLKNKVEQLERKERKKNLIIFGLEKEYATPNKFCDVLKKNLEVDLVESGIIFTG